MNQHQTNLLTQMEMFRKVRGTPPDGWVYAGIEDFLIREGTWYDPRPLPEGVPMGPQRNCFNNALVLAIMRGWTYVEGLAIPDITVQLSVHHAWNIAPDGQLIDNTWEMGGLAYIGIPFSTARARRANKHHAAVLDNPRERGKLYQQKWQGERVTA